MRAPPYHAVGTSPDMPRCKQASTKGRPQLCVEPRWNGAVRAASRRLGRPRPQRIGKIRSECRFVNTHTARIAPPGTGQGAAWPGREAIADRVRRVRQRGRRRGIGPRALSGAGALRAARRRKLGGRRSGPRSTRGFCTPRPDGIGAPRRRADASPPRRARRPRLPHVCERGRVQTMTAFRRCRKGCRQSVPPFAGHS